MMENGVEDNKPTIVKEEEEVIKTADGGVSVLNMVDNVVQVFHPKEDEEEEEEEENEQVGSEPPKPPTISEHEQENGDDKTKTTEGAISQLKLADKVVHVFHPDDVTKDSEQEQVEEEEADDVFEEAMTDHKPHSQDQQLLPHSPDKSGPLHHTNGDFHDSLEVKGKPCQVHDTVMFEEAVDSDLPSEDQDHLVVENVKTAGVAAVDPVVDGVRLADGLVDDMQLLPEELANGVVCSRKEDEDDNDVESRTSCDAAVRGDSGNGDDGVMTLDDQETSKELLLEESPDGVVCNEEGENRAAFANGEANPSTDAELESNGSCEVHDKSCNGGLIKSTVLAKYTDVGNTISDDTTPSGGVETAEQIRPQNNQGISGSFVAAVLGKTGNVGLEKLDSEEKPTLNFFPDFDKASSDVIALSERDGSGESSENIQSEYDDQKSEMRHTVAKEDTFVNEEAAEIENVSNNLGASVDEGTDRNRCHSDTIIDKRVGGDASELREKESQNVGAQRRSEGNEELSVKHPVVGEPKSPEIEDEHEKSSTLVGDSGSARVPEIQPAVEPVQAPPRRPAGLGGAASLFEHTPRALQQTRVNGAAPQRPAQLVEDPMNGEAEENDETREKLQMIRVKFLRLAHRLGQTPHNVVVAQVLYRLGLAEQLRGRNAGRAGAFSFDRASAMAEQLESAGQEALDFSCTIMVLGKTGVGKSATINSIFDEIKFSTDAFQMGTKKVQDVVGTVQGIKVRVIDTPGLLPCWSDQRQNEKILHSVKRFIKKSPPDIVLYLDRLDMQSRDFGDLPLLRTITEIFGPSIWFNAIVVLTHAASAPPDGPNGISSSYEMFVTQRSHVVQQAIRQAAGDMRLMNPVSLVENHSACRTNRAGQRVLPNGQVWKPHLLLLSFASKILAEANTLLKLQDNPPGKPFATRPRVPPLPFLLSSLLQSRPQLKLPEEQFGDEDDLDDELDESSDSDDELEFDELPPFKRLMKAQLAKLSKAQKKAYFDELEYREKLFMKKQLREEKKRRKLLKKMAGSEKEIPNDYPDNAEEESGGGGASLPVAMPDFSLPASFDSDNPSHRYRFLDTSNPWLVRPVLETHGWDHDVGYEGINVERLFVVKDKIPVSFSGQATKDKKESNLQMEVASSIKHNEGKATSVGFDMQTIGKDMSYTLRSETRFSSFRRNKTAAGLSVTLLGDALTAGVKLEDRLIVNKRFRLVMTGGAMTGRGDVAYGGSLEATLRDKDYPLGRTSSTLGLSIMDWHGDLAIGCNVQSQIPIGRSSNLIARANLNNRGSGQVSIRLNSSEQLQIALVGLLPLLRKGVSLYQQTLHGE